MLIDQLLTEEERLYLDLKELERATVSWQPNPDHSDGTPNPQRLALESDADELLYGGQAGGGKTDLLLGCPLLNHTKSVIFRRTFPNLQGVIDRSKEILGEDSYKGVRKQHDLAGERVLRFGYMQREDDKKNWQGRDHDFYGFDELTEFTRSQYQFVIGWNRSTKRGQRCRVIASCNPPIDQDGAWVVDEWAPWLKEDYHIRAKHGELLWYTYNLDGRLQWSSEPHSGYKSRTFIPANLDDNPYLGDDYLARLNAMPEPIRSAFRDGKWDVLLKSSNPFQVIPLAWIRAAQRRWLERQRPQGDPDAVGHDVSRGGADQTTCVGRWGLYFDILGAWSGANVPDGPTAAARVHESLNGLTPDIINVDLIGYGASSYDSLRAMGYDAQPINVSVRSEYTDKSEKLRCRDLRTELVWRMRDALDPIGGVGLCLPDNSELTADLCAYVYVPMAGGVIKIASKEEMKAQIGRSPDIGDAVLLANYTPPKDFVSMQEY